MTGDEGLTEEQTDLVCRFMTACPEMRDDQVRVWSARYPELAEEFETTAEILNEERENIELEAGEPYDGDLDRDFDIRSDEMFSAWKGETGIGATH